MNDSSPKQLKVCFFGTYDQKYSSNKIILDGLRANDVNVFELNIDTRITDMSKSNHLNPLALFKRIFIKFKLIPLIWNNLKEIKTCDIVFVGYPGHFDFIFAIVFAKLLRKKLVFYPLIILYVTFTEDVLLLNKYSLKATVLKFFEKVIYRLSDRVVADIPFQRPLFRKLFNIPDEKIREIPIGADDKIYHYSKKKKNHTFNVVYYGLYSPLHGVEHILYAANALKQYKNIKFIMVGKGQTFDENFKLAERLKLSNVIFHEFMTEENSKATLESADVFLGFLQESPSVHRVLPNKVYQGLALGKCVITADTEASRAVFDQKKNAYLVKPANPESLAKAIWELQNDPILVESIAENGYRLYTEKFSPFAIGKLLKTILYETL